MRFWKDMLLVNRPVTLSFLCLLATMVCPPGVPTAFAQDVSASTTDTLDLRLDTGTTPPLRRDAKTTTGRKALPNLASRKGSRSLRQEPAPAPRVLARLGVVMAENIVVRVGIEPSSRLLSQVAKGTNVAIIAEADDHWGILMVNNTVGWTPKTGIELMDYQTEVAVPGSDSSANPPSPEQEDTGALLNNTEGMSPTVVGILREAFTYLGVPYVWGGNSRNGLDCSAFVRNVFRTQGVELPRHSGHQIARGRTVQGPELQAGDRLYFDCSTKRSGIDHTGIYLGNGLFIHASGGRGKVVVESIFKPLYYNGLVAARRDFE